MFSQIRACIGAVSGKKSRALVKPQPEIFRLACERFGISAGESVFIDDTPANAEAAYYVGMRAVVFHGNTAELRRELETVLLEV